MPVVKAIAAALGGVVLGGALPALVAASSFHASMDASRWVAGSSVHECRISHDIPYFGRAVFVQAAGGAPGFQLLPQASSSGSGMASLVSAPPLWKPQGETYPLGRIAMKQGLQPLAVDGAVYKRLLVELLAGQEVVFSRVVGQDAESSPKVVLSPVNFRPAYQQYQQCLATLLPVNFEQIRRTALYFPSGSDTLPRGDLAKLDHIALYTEADDSVQSFYVDGHADSAGDRNGNLELSQRRAELVVSLLLERGIPLDKITTRWHGERYPVASNRAPESQAKNRRVTIRLERVRAGEPPAGTKERKEQQEMRAQQGNPQPERSTQVLQQQAMTEAGRAGSASWWLR